MRKTVSIILSFVLLVSSLFSLSMSAAADEGAYLFAYFTGNAVSRQQIHFAVSRDGLDFTALGGGQAVITAPKTAANNSSGCCRDPYIARAQDGGFYIVATDMDASEKWDGDTCIYVWYSRNLTDFTLINDFDVSAMGAFGDIDGSAHVILDGESFDLATTFRAWAPQFIWDNDEGRYMLYWSDYMCDETGAKRYDCPVLYSYTDDFISFTEPRVLYKAPSGAAIDEDIIYNADDGLYYMYYKDESKGEICFVTADNLTGPYSAEPRTAAKSSVALEGANCHFIGDKLIMLADAYGDGYYKAFESIDLVNFTELALGDYHISHLSPRHGSVVKITDSEYNALIEKFGLYSDVDIQYAFDSGYTAETGWAYETFLDASDCYYNVITQGKSTVNNGTATLTNSSLMLGDNLVRDILSRKCFTLSFTYTLSAYGGSVMCISDAKKDCVYLSSSGILRLNQQYAASTEIKQGTKYLFTMTYDGTTFSLYRNGALVASTAAALDIKPIGETGYLSLGFSEVNDNARANASFSGVRIRNRVLTSSEIKKEYEATLPQPAPAQKTSISGAKVTGVANKTYTGKSLTQSVKVQLGSKTLKSGTDYTVSYADNKNVGTATVTVTGKGSYTGTVKKTFKINPKGTTISKLTKGKRSFTAKWTKQTSQTTGYVIQYAENAKFSKARTVTVTKNKTVKTTVKKLKAKKKYYVRIRTYKTVKGVKYYSAWSKAKTVTTKK